jgi:hypothetical protein
LFSSSIDRPLLRAIFFVDALDGVMSAMTMLRQSTNCGLPTLYRFLQLCATTLRMRRSLLMVLALCFVVYSAASQTEKSLPTVTAFDCPKYPQKAESMRLQGMVQMEVTTDGHQVTNVKLLPSHPILAEEAVKNVHTWRFADHQPTTFLVKYFYVQ